MKPRALQSNTHTHTHPVERCSSDSVASPAVVIGSPRKAETTRARTQHPGSPVWFWLPTCGCLGSAKMPQPVGFAGAVGTAAGSGDAPAAVLPLRRSGGGARCSCSHFSQGWFSMGLCRTLGFAGGGRSQAANSPGRASDETGPGEVRQEEISHGFVSGSTGPRGWQGMDTVRNTGLVERETSHCADLPGICV